MLTDKNSPKSVIEQDPFVTNCFFCITSPHVHHTFIAHLGIGEMQFLSNTIQNICVFVLLTINYCTITFFSFRRKCHACPGCCNVGCSKATQSHGVFEGGHDIAVRQFQNQHSAPLAETGTFFPTCQVRVVRFYGILCQSLLLLLLLLLFRLLVSLSDLNHDLVSSVWRVGPQPRAREFSVACRTSTASS